MLLLAEQLMLLALHDEKDSIIFSASTALPFGLTGAIILDLFFRGKVIQKDNLLSMKLFL